MPVPLCIDVIDLTLLLDYAILFDAVLQVARKSLQIITVLCYYVARLSPDLFINDPQAHTPPNFYFRRYRHTFKILFLSECFPGNVHSRSFILYPSIVLV